MKVLAVVGSPRVDGNTSFLVDQALAEIAKSGIETEKVIVSQLKIGPCLAHDDCGQVPACHQNDDMKGIIDKVWNADGIILGSPTYFHNVTGQLKVFIDRNRFYHRQQRKMKARAAGIVAVANGSGSDIAVQVLKRFLGSTSNIPPEKILVAEGLTKPPMIARANPELIEQAKTLGRKMAAELKGSQASK